MLKGHNYGEVTCQKCGKLHIHPLLGKSRIFSELHKLHISLSKKGKPNHPQTEKTRLEIGLTHKGVKHTEEQNILNRLRQKGKHPISEELKQRIISATTGIPKTEEHKQKIRIATIGHIVSEERREKNRQGTIRNWAKNHDLYVGKHCGKAWKGGIAHLPYPYEYNEQLRNEIRCRDNYTCQLCGVSEHECIKGLCVHHIDYVKENSTTTNLIALCSKCHGKTTQNRHYWTGHLSKMMQDRFEESALLRSI